MRPAEPAPDRLRDAFGASADRAGTDCPSAEAIWMAVARELPPDEIRPIVLHTAACGSCAEAWRLGYRTILGEGLAHPAPVPAAPAWRSIWVLGPGLAAAALLAVGVLVERPFDERPFAPSSTLRSGAEAAIRPLLEDGAIVDRSQLVLRWTPHGEGTRYDVTLAAEDLTVISRAQALTEPQYAVPASALAPLPSGTKLFWQVSAIGAEQVRTVSPTFMIQLR